MKAGDLATRLAGRTVRRSRNGGRSVKAAIDQSLCRGDCICEEICPAVFVLDPDGIAHVSERGQLLDGPGGWATVPPNEEPAVLDAAAECPTQAIFVQDA